MMKGTNIATRILVKQGKGKELLKRLTDFKNNIVGVGGDSLKAEIEKLYSSIFKT